MKTCIITGASDGIGRSIAIQLSEIGLYENLILIARDSEKLKKTQKMLKYPEKSFIIPFDLIALENIPLIIQNVHNQFKSIDCLLNIAGYTDPQPLLQTTVENLEKTYAINVFAPIMMMRECVKFMKQNNGISKILNVASTAGMSPRPGWLSYASSKAAIIAVSQTLVEELAEYNIKVYCVSPGRCATSLRRKLAPNEDQTKIMQPEEVAHVICNLLRNDENCLDGQNIIIRKK